MRQNSALSNSVSFSLLVGVALLSGLQTSKAQVVTPDLPRNAISPAIPYEQGIANILASGATRPVAVQPITSRGDIEARGATPAPGPVPPAIPEAVPPPR